MRILFVTGSRGEWGYIRPILRLIEKDPEIEYDLCVTNMHLLPDFGSSEDEIISPVETTVHDLSIHCPVSIRPMLTLFPVRLAHSIK